VQVFKLVCTRRAQAGPISDKMQYGSLKVCHLKWPAVELWLSGPG
jgi:hypothetical protein